MNLSPTASLPLKSLLATSGIVMFGFASLSAQFAFTPENLVYSEDFSHLNTSSSGGYAKAWVDDVTVPHWRARVADASASIYNVTHGGSGASGLQVWDMLDGEGGRALGMLTDNTNKNALLAFGMLNSTGGVIDEIKIDFTQAQWYGGNGGANDKMAFSYQANHNSHMGGIWSAFPELDLDGFVSGPGGLAEPIFTDKSATLGGLNWQPGEQLWVRWLDLDVSSGDAGAGFASINVTAIPEPGTYAFAAGLAMLTVVLVHRRVRRATA